LFGTLNHNLPLPVGKKANEICSYYTSPHHWITCEIGPLKANTVYKLKFKIWWDNDGGANADLHNDFGKLSIYTFDDDT